MKILAYWTLTVIPLTHYVLLGSWSGIVYRL